MASACYRIYRHPIIMFGLGPAFLFIIQHRLPVGLMRAGWQPWLSAMATNVAIAAIVATVIWLVGVLPFLIVHLPIMLLAASVGVWLFYVQHQFEDTEWAPDSPWNLQEAALHGSSYYDLPGVLRWFTANIGVHHVHHLCSRIPSIDCHWCCAITRSLASRPTYLNPEFQVCAAGALGRRPAASCLFCEVRQR